MREHFTHSHEGVIDWLSEGVQAVIELGVLDLEVETDSVGLGISRESPINPIINKGLNGLLYIFNERTLIIIPRGPSSQRTNS